MFRFESYIGASVDNMRLVAIVLSILLIASCTTSDEPLEIVVTTVVTESDQTLCSWSIYGFCTIYFQDSVASFLYNAQKMDANSQDSVFVVFTLWQAKDGYKELMFDTAKYIPPRSNTGVYFTHEWYLGVIDIGGHVFNNAYDYFPGLRVECIRKDDNQEQ